jgi:hypothetical protein
MIWRIPKSSKRCGRQVEFGAHEEECRSEPCDDRFHAALFAHSGVRMTDIRSVGSGADAKGSKKPFSRDASGNGALLSFVRPTELGGQGPPAGPVPAE